MEGLEGPAAGPVASDDDGVESNEESARIHPDARTEGSGTRGVAGPGAGEDNVAWNAATMDGGAIATVTEVRPPSPAWAPDDAAEVERRTEPAAEPIEKDAEGTNLAPSHPATPPPALSIVAAPAMAIASPVLALHPQGTALPGPRTAPMATDPASAPARILPVPRPAGLSAAAALPTAVRPGPPSILLGPSASTVPAKSVATAAARTPPASKKRKRAVPTAPATATATAPVVTTSIDPTTALEDMVLECLRDPHFAEYTRAVANIFVARLL